MSGHANRRIVGDDAGAVMIEFALIIPVLAMLLFGAVEMGFGWQAKTAMTGVARAAGKAASATWAGGGNQPPADHSAIAQIVGITEGIPATVQRIVVYDASNYGGGNGASDSIDGRVPETCQNISLAGVTEPFTPSGTSCNVYPGVWVHEVYDTVDTDLFVHSDQEADGYDNEADGPSYCSYGVDSGWCPENREADQTALPNGPDYVGVYVDAERDTLTGFFDETLKMTTYATYRMEPDVPTDV